MSMLRTDCARALMDFGTSHFSASPIVDDEDEMGTPDCRSMHTELIAGWPCGCELAQQWLHGSGPGPIELRPCFAHTRALAHSRLLC
jgi:hypothetical protein